MTFSGGEPTLVRMEMSDLQLKERSTTSLVVQDLLIWTSGIFHTMYMVIYSALFVN